MIRINLLPQSKRQAAAAGAGGSAQTWAIAYMVTAAVWTIGLAIVYFVYDGTLEEQRQANAALQTQIDQMRSRSARLEEVKEQLEQSQQLEQVVRELDRARTGPVRVLMELVHVLSQGGGPTIDPARLEQLRRDNPLAGFNPTWDVRRLWLTELVETENHRVTIKGQGRTNEDVAEFLRRLSLSDLFAAVALTKTEAKADAASGLALINFEMTCEVRY